jgi:hypothetical protein
MATTTTDTVVADPPEMGTDKLRPVPAFDLDSYRRGRVRELERQVELLSAERQRLELLLGLACRAAVAGTGVGERNFLAVLCAFVGTNPARPAFVERCERQESAARLDRVVAVLRETHDGPPRDRHGP